MAGISCHLSTLYAIQQPSGLKKQVACVIMDLLSVLRP